MNSQGKRELTCMCPPCSRTCARDLACQVLIQRDSHSPSSPGSPRRGVFTDNEKYTKPLATQIKGFVLRTERPLPARATSSSFSVPRVSKLPTGERGIGWGKFYMISGVETDPQQLSARWAASPRCRIRFSRTVVFFSLPSLFFSLLNFKTWLDDGRDEKVTESVYCLECMASGGQEWSSQSISGSYWSTIYQTLPCPALLAVTIPRWHIPVRRSLSLVVEKLSHLWGTEAECEQCSTVCLRLANICLLWRNT